jgi:hypothetical protein
VDLHLRTILNDRVQLSFLIVRFEIAIPDLIETSVTPTNLLLPTPQGTHYRILQNNDYGLVDHLSVSGFVEGGKDPFVGATSVVINKTTGAFYWAEAITIKDETIFLNQTHHGKCLHD